MNSKDWRYQDDLSSLTPRQKHRRECMAREQALRAALPPTNPHGYGLGEPEAIRALADPEASVLTLASVTKTMVWTATASIVIEANDEQAAGENEALISEPSVSEPSPSTDLDEDWSIDLDETYDAVEEPD